MENKNFKFETRSKLGFYIGDPCYALLDTIYDKMIDLRPEDENHNYILACEVEIDGYKICVGNTKWGDGFYDNRFPVDSGQIAIIPLELCMPVELIEEYGVIDLNEDFNNEDNKSSTFEYDDGIFYIDGYGEIDTVQDYDNEDEESEDEED